MAAATGTIGRAAVAAFHAGAHPRNLVALFTIEAQSVSGVAVQLDDVFGCDARGLMQVIDVLRHHSGHLSGPIKAYQRPMPSARLGLAELILHREAPPPGFVPRLLACQKLVERNRPILRPDTARRAEIGNAAFGGNAGPGKRQDDDGLRDHVRKSLYRAAEIRIAHPFDPLFLPFCRRPTYGSPQWINREYKSDTSRGTIMRYLHTMLRVRN